MEPAPSSSLVSIGSDILLLRDQAADGPDEFMCNICKGLPSNSVMTWCGHMFCWSCLYGWTANQEKPCPVCEIMLREGSMVPVYGCQQGSNSTSDGSIPPRPIAPGLAASIRGSGPGSSASRQPNGGADSDSEGELIEFDRTAWRPENSVWLRDPQIEFALWSRAQGDFQAIRGVDPPSSAAWIAEASDNFSPCLASADEALGPAHDLHVFVHDVLVPQGEFVPRFCDFQRTWLPFYQFRNPELSPREHHDDFLESWGMHFYQAWDRAGRPAYRPVVAGTVIEVSSDDSSSESGSICASEDEEGSWEGSSSTRQESDDAETDAESDLEVEFIDATEYETSLQIREVSRNGGDEVSLRSFERQARGENEQRNLGEISPEREDSRIARRENAQANRRANRQRPY